MLAVDTAAERAVSASGDNAPDLSVTGVAPDVVASVWPHIEPMIEAAREAVPEMVAAREYAEDIREKASRGLYQVWMIYDGHDLAAVAVTSVEQFTRIKVCVVHYLAGMALEKWIGTWIDEIQDWAKDSGCAQIECRGRWGWGKKLKPFGAETAGAAYVMGIG